MTADLPTESLPYVSSLAAYGEVRTEHFVAEIFRNPISGVRHFSRNWVDMIFDANCNCDMLEHVC